MVEDSGGETPDVFEEEESSKSDGLAGVFLGLNAIVLYIYYQHGALISLNSASVPDGALFALGCSYIALFSLLAFMVISYGVRTAIHLRDSPPITNVLSVFVLTIYIPCLTAIAFFGISPFEPIQHVLQYLV